VLEKGDLNLTTDPMLEKCLLNLALYMVLRYFASLLSRDFIELFYLVIELFSTFLRF
jgi:hypothetical protein